MIAALLGLVLQSGLRSLALGIVVWLLLKLLRVRDCTVEALAWTVVLLCALAMPALALWTPGLIRLPLPQFATAAPLIAAPAVAHAPAEASGAAALWALYGLGVTVFLVRLSLGLGLTLRLYLRAEPVDQPWAKGLKVRASGEITSPFAFADCILVPADYWRWPRRTLAAVLAHEQTHVRRGDFFIQLLASINRALFWFNPFAWWLRSRLSELAERASDRAAVQTIQDRAAYAEILVETARAAGRRSNLHFASGSAMAHGSGVARRIEDILADVPEQAAPAPARWGVLAGVLVVSLALAEVRATAADGPTSMAGLNASARPLVLIAAVKRMAESPAPPHKLRLRATRMPAPAAEPAPPAQTSAAPARRYDPRALIEDPSAGVLPALVATGAGRAALVPQLSQGAVQGE